MRLDHEGVEMDASLRAHTRFGKEKIHQHGFAAPDVAPDVEPARRRLGLEEEAWARPIMRKRARQSIELLRRLVLGSVVLQFASRNRGAIAIEKRHARGRMAQ